MQHLMLSHSESYARRMHHPLLVVLLLLLVLAGLYFTISDSHAEPPEGLTWAPRATQYTDTGSMQTSANTTTSNGQLPASSASSATEKGSGTSGSDRSGSGSRKNGISSTSSKGKSKAVSREKENALNPQQPGEVATATTASMGISPGSPPALANMHTPEGCPAWIAEYAAFHQQQRGTPGAKYLLYAACPGKSGLGDRIRGLMYLTRQAAAHKRVVLSTWRGNPHDAERYLPPAGPIDWTLNGIAGYDYPSTDTYCADNVTLPDYSILTSKTTGSLALRATDYKGTDIPARRFIRAGGLKQLAHHPFVSVHTNEWMSKPCTDCPDLADPMPVVPTQSKSKRGPMQIDNSAVCLFRYLFGLSVDVQTAAQQQLVASYGPQAAEPNFKFVAMHMRIGGMEHEKSLQHAKGGQNGPLLDLIRGMACIEKLGHRVGVNISQVPVLLFTDHQELRNFVRSGRLANVVTSAIKPMHLARMTKEEAVDPDAAISTYADVALLARAQCAVYSKSGFSATAWMMGGGTDCYAHFTRDMQSCLK